MSRPSISCTTVRMMLAVHQVLEQRRSIGHEVAVEGADERLGIRLGVGQGQWHRMAP